MRYSVGLEEMPIRRPVLHMVGSLATDDSGGLVELALEVLRSTDARVLILDVTRVELPPEDGLPVLQDLDHALSDQGCELLIRMPPSSAAEVAAPARRELCHVDGSRVPSSETRRTGTYS